MMKIETTETTQLRLGQIRDHFLDLGGGMRALSSKGVMLAQGINNGSLEPNPVGGGKSSGWNLPNAIVLSGDLSVNPRISTQPTFVIQVTGRKPQSVYVLKESLALPEKSAWAVGLLVKKINRLKREDVKIRIVPPAESVSPLPNDNDHPIKKNKFKADDISIKITGGVFESLQSVANALYCKTNKTQAQLSQVRREAGQAGQLSSKAKLDVKRRQAKSDSIRAILTVLFKMSYAKLEELHRAPVTRQHQIIGRLANVSPSTVRRHWQLVLHGIEGHNKFKLIK